MQLLTKKLEKRFAHVGRQGKLKDPIVVCKFFDPTGSGTWYACEMYYVLKDGLEIVAGENSALGADDPDVEDILFYGWVYICEGELGYFSLNELKNIKLRFGLGIERDKFFVERKLSECISIHNQR